MTVYIVNRSNHDFSDAEQYGRLEFLSEGQVNRFAVNDMARKFGEMMVNSERTDRIVLCSLNVMNAVACAIFASKHHCLNLLLFKNGKYLERNIML